MADLKSLSTFKFTELQADDRVKAIQMAWNGSERLAKLLILVPSQNIVDLGSDSTNAFLRYGIKHHR